MKPPERKPGDLTAAEREEIDRQFKEREEWLKELPPGPPARIEYTPGDIEDAPQIWDAINKMTDIERYKKLLELEVRDWVIHQGA